MSDDQSNQNNQFLNISILIAKLETKVEQGFSTVNQDMQELKNEMKAFRQEYMPRTESKLQIDSILTTIQVLQNQVKTLLDWQIAETKRSAEEKGETQNSLNTRIISWQGGILIAIIGFIVWLIQQYLTTHH